MEDTRVFKEFENFDFENNAKFKSGWSSVVKLVDKNKIEIEYLKAKLFFFSKYCRSINLKRYLAWKEEEKSEGASNSGNDQLKGASNQIEVIENKEQESEFCDNDPSVCNKSASLLYDSKQMLPYQPNNHNENSTKLNDNIGSSNSVYSQSSLHTVSSSLAAMELTPSDSHSKDESDESNAMALKSDVKDSDKSNAKLPISISDNHTSEEEGACLSLFEVAAHIQSGTPIPGLVSIEVKATNLEPTPSQCHRKLKPWESATSQEKAS